MCVCDCSTAVGLLLHRLPENAVDLKAGDTSKFRVLAPVAGSVVVWEFRTEHYDVAFAADFTPISSSGAGGAGAGGAGAGSGPLGTVVKPGRSASTATSVTGTAGQSLWSWRVLARVVQACVC